MTDPDVWFCGFCPDPGYRNVDNYGPIADIALLLILACFRLNWYNIIFETVSRIHAFHELYTRDVESVCRLRKLDFWRTVCQFGQTDKLLKQKNSIKVRWWGLFRSPVLTDISSKNKVCQYLSIWPSWLSVNWRTFSPTRVVIFHCQPSNFMQNYRAAKNMHAVNCMQVNSVDQI